MTQVLELVFPHDGPTDQPAVGRLSLDHAVTFIAGPNGSGKSRLLKWLAPHLANVSEMPLGSRIRFELADISLDIGAEIILAKKGPGPFEGKLAMGRIIHAGAERVPNLQLPAAPTDFTDNSPNYELIIPKTLRDRVGPRRLEPRQQAVVMLDGDFAIPASYLTLHFKVLTAVRLRNLHETMPRRANVREFIFSHRAETTPHEAFALLDDDPALEIEILARVEALTGVKCQLVKAGNAYQITCRRVGRPNEWGLDREADGVISLLILLPYLFSPRYRLLFIDEPESHLYPGLQQTLRSLVYDAAERTGKKIVLATHSEKIVAPPAPHFRESIHVMIPHPARPELMQLRAAIDQLGADAGEIHDWLSKQAFGDNQDSIFAALFASEVVVVEGPYDMMFMDRIARYVGREFRAGSIALVEAGGNKGVAKLVKFLKTLGRMVKVVVDDDVFHEPTTLTNIATAMGAPMPDLANLDTAKREKARTDLKKYDVHILTKAGIEHYYRTLAQGQVPTDNGDKRAALIRELKSIEPLEASAVRSRFPELIAVLEAAVRRMPPEWLSAHQAELVHILGQIMMGWREAREAGRTYDTTLAKGFFAKVEHGGDRIRLTHRFLSEPPIELQPESDSVRVAQDWIRQFRTANA